jgi:hypothetical protein
LLMFTANVKHRKILELQNQNKNGTKLDKNITTNVTMY